MPDADPNPYAWAQGDDHVHEAVSGTWSGWHVQLAPGQLGVLGFVCSCGETWQVERVPSTHGSDGSTA